MPEEVGFTTMGRAVKATGAAPRLGVGMLGYAFMGKAHAHAYLEIPHICHPPAAIPELVAVAGRTKAAVEAAAARYGFRRVYRDWRRLLADPDVQLFDNGGPNNVHADANIAAAEAGKHVISEKPLGRTAAESKAMLRAVQKAGVRHMTAFNCRFVPAVRQARHLIEQGALGTIYHFRAKYCQEWIMDPQFPRVWRLQKSIAGSGALGDLGAHIVDLARFLVGEPVTVNGRLKTFIKSRPLPEDPQRTGRVDVDDAFVALVEFANGALGTLEATRFAAGRKNYNTFEINGSEGSLLFNLERLNELEVHLRDTQPITAQGFRNVLVSESNHPFWNWWWPQGHIIGWEHTFVHELYHFVHAIATGAEVAPYGATFEDGYRADVILEAIATSAAEGGAEVRIRY
ncbi:MAG: Gfo/Idh/MocA family oxidoreductase [Actinobacteria bacterium]|nr:Gfo/Idh/MocA family oxidoreductase [Actinomycetota bacterium]